MDMTGDQDKESAVNNPDGDGAPSSAPPVDGVDAEKTEEGPKDPTPTQGNDSKPSEHASSQKSANVAGGKGDSEAETEILSGKEDSPKKQTRKAIKLEQPDSTSDINVSHRDKKEGATTPAHLDSPRPTSLKRKRGAEEPTGADSQDDHDSSRLSSTVSSPRIERRTSEEVNSKSNRSESSPFADDAEQQTDAVLKKPDQQKFKGVKESTVNGRKRRETRSATDVDDSTNRSTSPPIRKPQRAQSSQSNPSSTQGVKKRKKAPAPLQVDRRSRPSEDAHDSDSSSVRSHQRDQPLKSADMGAWKAKLSTKKNKDRSGRTLLARACAISYEEAEKWLEERPEDIDVDDNAGNTPLQIASLEGNADIVKLLIDHGCKTDGRNVDNDTPLIDAVENGHLEVVQLLLDAGVDPSQRNATGKEPIELVSPSLDDAEEIRASILASKKSREKRRQSEDQSRRQNSASREPRPSVTANSAPSPTLSTRSPPLDPGARRRTARSQHTNDALLWVNPTPQRLRDAAGKGDMTIVNYILNMKPEADTEAVLAAAQGGHDEILGLILAIAQPEADPAPLRSPDLKPGHTTPMLAAIGRGNVKVLKLLLDQPGFDPTRRLYKGRTYYELAEDRQSSEWREEHDVLKEAYTQYKRHGGRKSNHSTPQRVRAKRNGSRQSSPEPSSSPHEVRKVRRPQLLVKEEPDSEPRRKPLYQGTAAKVPDEDRKMSAVSSDQEIDRPKKKERKIGNRVRSASPSQKNVVKPKRTLVSGNDIKLDRESRRQRALDDLHLAGSPRKHKSREISGGSGVEKKERPSESALAAPLSRKATSESPGRIDRAKDESSKKRLRSSVSPHASRLETAEAVKKKKRLRVDSHGKASEDHSQIQTRPAPPANMVASPTETSLSSTMDAPAAAAPVAFMGSGKSSPAANTLKESPMESQLRASRTSLKRTQSQADGQAAAEKTTISVPEDVVMKDVEEDPQEKEKRLEKERVEEAEAQARQREEAELQRQIQREKEEAETAALIAREKEEARLEEERKLQREKEEAEAALAKKKREEELHKRRAEQERQRREEQERRRREAEERESLRLMRAQQEEERQRREALPHGLRRYIELSDEARSKREIHRWLPLRTVTTRDLEAGCETFIAEERWISNVQAAPLLANKDLELSQYTAWARRPATNGHSDALWRQLRNPMSQATPHAIVSSVDAFHLENENRPKFFNLNIFWIKVSDFMDIVPRHAHLAGITFSTRDFVLEWPSTVLHGGAATAPGGEDVKGLGIKQEGNPSPPSAPIVNGIHGSHTTVNGHR